MLTQFQLAELRESLAGVVELNGDHAAVQPQRLADLLPAQMEPALRQMQAAVDAQDGLQVQGSNEQTAVVYTAKTKVTAQVPDHNEKGRLHGVATVAGTKLFGSRAASSCSGVKFHGAGRR